MRDIKFRVWDKRELKMLSHNDVNNSDKDAVIMWSEIFNNTKPDLVLMQFTGFYDKLGNEIYEGDVVQIINYYNKLDSAQVLWNKRTGGFVLDYPCSDKSFSRLTGKTLHRVLGNIYENPELLTK